MDTWALPKITDYWEHSTKAIEEMAARLDSLSVEQRDASVAELAAEVDARARCLDDRQLTMAGFVMLEDLYKSMVACTWWTSGISEYLGATARVLCTVLAERGFVLHYVVSNTFPDVATPLQVFPWWFNSAGLLFTGPQHAALSVMEELGREPSADDLPPYVAEGARIAADLVDRCHEGRRSYAFFILERTDAEGLNWDDALAKAVSMRTKRGVVCVLRTEVGTTAKIWLPEGMDW